MAKPLNLFHSRVAPFVVGAPAPILDQAIAHAARRFCEMTGLYQEVNTVSVLAGTSDYDVDIPTGAQLLHINTVWYGNEPLEAVSVEDVKAAVAVRGQVGDEVPGSGKPLYFYQKLSVEDQFSLYPVPDADFDGGVTVRASYTLSADITTVPDFLYTQHADAIAKGALAYLFGIPGYDFSNARMAETYERQFGACVGSQKDIARGGRSQRKDRVQPRPFA